MFYLYNVKMAGWVSNGVSPYTSDITDAQKFNEEDMIQRVRLNKSPTGLGVIPVDADWLETLA